MAKDGAKSYTGLALIWWLCVGAIGACALERLPSDASTSKSLPSASESMAVEYKCTGESTGNSSLTGMQVTMPDNFRLKISDKTATLIYEFYGGDYESSYLVDERDNAYVINATLDGGTRGEKTLLVDKDSGVYKERSWLFFPENVSSSIGICEIQ